jgi:hypothetical protein
VLHNARLLLGCIKLMLFFLAFVISQSVYFAAFFGTESCFFSRTGAQCAAQSRHGPGSQQSMLTCCIDRHMWSQIRGRIVVCLCALGVRPTCVLAPQALTCHAAAAAAASSMLLLTPRLSLPHDAGFQKAPRAIPWFAIMIIDICLLLSLALFTLPLYTITSHTLNINKRLVQQIVQQQKDMKDGGPPHGNDHSHWEDGH